MQAKVRRCVNMLTCLNVSTDGASLTVSDKLFHSLGPTTENTRSPLIFSWVHGVKSSSGSAVLGWSRDEQL